MEPKMEQKKITQGDLVSMFLRSNLQQASFNFERIHGLGFCYDMIPAIKRLYPLKADQVAALNAAHSSARPDAAGDRRHRRHGGGPG